MHRLAFLLTLALVSLAHAEPLRIDRSQEKMRVDGALLEWRGAHFRELGSGDDTRLRFAAASVDGGLYLGIELYDDTLVTGGDVVVLTLAMPKDKGVDVSEVWLYPGQGSVRARALLARNGAAPQAESQIQIVEGPLAHGAGCVVEAFVPWAVIAGSEGWRDGRGALRWLDVDGKGAPSTLRSDPETRPAQQPRLALGFGQEDLLGSFLSEHDLVGVPPRYDFREDVAGDARKERVVIIGQYVVVFGPGFKNGESYSYNILPFSQDGGLRNAALIDLTGDGRRELVATGRQSNPLGLREAWVVFELEELGMQQLFGIELKKESKGGFLDNSVNIVPGKAAAQAPGARELKSLPRIEQKLGRALGLDATTYHETPATDLQPVLLPWGEVTSRTFAYDGKKFGVVGETKRALPTAAVAAAPVASQAALPPESAPDHGALVAQFKRQQGLPTDLRASQLVRANVFGTEALEQVEVFGRLLLFTGPDVGEGNGFMSYGAPVGDPRDLLEVRAADVTGDTQAELLLRVRQTLSGAEGVQRELLAVLRADAEGRFARVLLVEVARRQGQSAIENQLAVKNGVLTITPGIAKGWAANAYPFTNEATGGAQRLLLPWLDKPVRYGWTDRGLVAAEP
jgi:hypothetical protein